MKPTRESGQVKELVDLIVTRYHQIESTVPLLSRELTDTGRKALKVVARAGRITIGHLGAALDAPPSTTTWVVNDLVSRGIFKRARDTGDRRKTWLELDEKGRALAGLMERIPDRIAADLLYKLDESQREQFVALVGVALTRIEEAGSFR